MERKTFVCECYNEILLVEYDEGDGLFDLTMFYRGYLPEKTNLWQRTKNAVKYLRTGEVSSNYIFLAKESAKELAEFIQKHSK